MSKGAVASRLATVKAKKAEENKSDRFPHKSTVWLLVIICVCSIVLTCFVLLPQLYSLAIIIGNDFVYDPFENGTCRDRQTFWPSTTPPVVLFLIALVIHVAIIMILAMMCAIIVETYLKLLISDWLVDKKHTHTSSLSYFRILVVDTVVEPLS